MRDRRRPRAPAGPRFLHNGRLVQIVDTMPASRRRLGAKIALAAALAIVLALIALRGTRMHHPDSAAPAHPVWSLAVLGDSDSDAYHDRVLIPEDGSKRGGALRASTWQWTEVLAQLRGERLDLGAWGQWGMPMRLAQVRRWVGLSARAPRKEDHRYNLAISGAECPDLMQGVRAMAPALVDLMDEDPQRWRNGIVAIRIGINTLGTTEQLDRYAREGASPAVRADMLACADQVRAAVALIRARHPQVRLALVGLFDNADWQPNFERWTAAEERRNIGAALDVYDDALRALAARTPQAAFFDDRAWFRRHWGERDAQGRPAYARLAFGGKAQVAQTRGDAPTNAVLGDGHAGSAWNGLWASDFVDFLNASFDARIAPITPAEIAGLIDPDGRWGLRPD